ncbi:hypothetical protein EDC16_103270 [Testudinibacter aquarius]|uniref:Uncharacterized protein n=1 Tax=Testudinibacter aquarius TaxID=1524974 RepID=A0A4R3YB19_9PAST|nr:hypothetical protein EDC16_103270 [Testudinibacter aquarius]
MKGLDKSIYRSMETQIQRRIKNLKPGTEIRKVIIAWDELI